MFNHTYIALHKGSAIEPEVRRFLSCWTVKSTASCAGPALSPISVRPACRHLNPVYGMKADSQETACLTVPMLHYIKALLLSLRLVLFSRVGR